jgi:hypothetical protein
MAILLNASRVATLDSLPMVIKLRLVKHATQAAQHVWTMDWLETLTNAFNALLIIL